MQIVCLLYGGPARKIFDRMNRVWQFEDHPQCGPSVVDRHGDPLTNQPPESSPFWEAVNLWYAQGKRTKPPVGKDVWCVWDRPTMRKMRHLGGKHYQLVTDDEASNAGVTGLAPEQEVEKK